jgi:farnesyl-diphosphate farnesyltransferase
VPNLDDLLEKTSRTFALSIPRLPEPTRREVTIAYLLFRIADTLEDAAKWPRDQRVDELGAFAGLLADPTAGPARAAAERWLGTPPVDHAGYLELLDETPGVLGEFAALAPAARAILHQHLAGSAAGMARFVGRGRAAGELVLSTLDDLRDYCYVVAGIVGEMLTELFLLERPALLAHADALRERSRAFGEGLQLVNILKDAEDDRGEGRCYVPPAVDRALVFDLARTDLERATEYVHVLQRGGAPSGVVAFCALPVLLARATLDRVETRGPGAKLSRLEVATMVARLEFALVTGSPAAA